MHTLLLAPPGAPCAMVHYSRRAHSLEIFTQPNTSVTIIVPNHYSGQLRADSGDTLGHSWDILGTPKRILTLLAECAHVPRHAMPSFVSILNSFLTINFLKRSLIQLHISRFLFLPSLSPQCHQRCLEGGIPGALAASRHRVRRAPRTRRRGRGGVFRRRGPRRRRGW